MTWPDETEGILDAAMDEFGEDVTHLPKAGGSHTTRWVFRAASLSVDVDGTVGVQSTGPVAGIQFSKLPVRPVDGDVFLRARDGLRYRVNRMLEEGEGGAQLHLSRITA